MARRKIRTDLDSPEPPTVEQLLRELPPERPRGRLRAAAIVVGLLALSVAFAPQIVCRTPLVHRLVAWATGDLRGQLTLKQASLGWWSTPELGTLELVDDEGRPVVRCARIVGDRTLWNLLTEPSRLGRYRIERPEIDLAVFEDGTTNVERVLEKFFAVPPGRTSGTAVDVACEIVDGVLTVHDRVTERRWTIDRVNAVVVLPADGASPLTADVKGALVESDGPKQLAAQSSWRNIASSDRHSYPQGDAALSIESLPLELVQTAARRFAPGLAIAGRLQGGVRTRFDLAAEHPTADASGRFVVDRLAIGGPLLAGDELRLARLELPLAVVLDGRRLQIDELGASCELASVAARGSLERCERLLDVAGWSQLTELLLDCDGRATARLNLARIAQAVPHVLRVRDDVQITGGEVVLDCTSEGAPGARRRVVDLQTVGLTAVRGGAPLAWNQPLRATISARDAAGGPVVERVQCASDFLTVDGLNEPDAFRLTAQYDLARLGAQLAEFVDLAGVQLRGGGTAQAAWHRVPNDRFETEGRATIDDFALAFPGAPAWTERQLVLALQASGRSEGLTPVALDEAAAGLQSAGDELTIRLTGPVADVRAAAAVWPLDVAARGELATWLARVRPFVGFPAAAAAEGRAELSATGRLSPNGDVEITRSRLVAAPLRTNLYGLTVDEPSAELQLAGRYRGGEWAIDEATLAATSMQVQVRQSAYRSGKWPTGTAVLRGDVARLGTLLGGGRSAPLPAAGTLEGSVRLQDAGRAVRATLDATVQNFVFGSPGGAVWNEPLVRLQGLGSYDPASDSLDVERLEASTGALQLRAAGRVAQPSGVCHVDCRGAIGYDWSRLAPLVQHVLGTGVVLEGRETQNFELSGPLADPARPGVVPWEKLDGAARIGWQRADLYGFPLGATTIDARLNQGLLRTNPLEAAVGTGRIRCTPSLRLGPGPMELLVDPGTIVDHVTITPEMADRRLKYVLPILAGAVQVAGQFSVALDELRLPLDDPTTGALAGRMTVHAVDVGTGALTQELASVLQQPAAVGLTRESVVDFKMIQGRIYHQNLEFAFPGTTIRTSGSVGLDQSLSLAAEVPIPEQWLAGRPIATAGLLGQKLRIPIAGTLQSPRLDRDMFRQASAQFMQNAAQGAVQEGLNRGLERLLGPSGVLAPRPGSGTR